MKTKTYIVSILVIAIILIGVYVGINYRKIFLSGKIVTLNGRFELPEDTKACIGFLDTDDYGMDDYGVVEIWPNFPENIREQFKEQEGCALQEHFNGKNVRIKGELKYVVCKPEEFAQCVGEFWAIASIDSIEIIIEELLSFKDYPQYSLDINKIKKLLPDIKCIEFKSVEDKTYEAICSKEYYDPKTQGFSYKFRLKKYNDFQPCNPCPDCYDYACDCDTDFKSGIVWEVTQRGILEITTLIDVNSEEIICSYGGL